MKRHRVWVEILLLGTLIACVLALVLATVGAVASAAAASIEPRQMAPPATERTFEGMVTCSRCGAKHSPSLARAADTCVRMCVHDGGSFALVVADSTYILEGDMSALKKVAGQRARIVGTLSGNKIKISSVASET